MSFYNKDKKGTIVISTHRSGTHFLLDTLTENLNRDRIPFVNLGELDSPLIPQIDPYIAGIINAVVPKITLVKQQELLKDYHVIKLTRLDKINHWISYYIWQEFNTTQQRFDNSNLPHHGGTRKKYSNLDKRMYPMDHIETWLIEQYMVNLFTADLTLDYSELKKYEDGIRWAPNDYGLTLEDLFINYKEIAELLQTYKVPNV